MATWINADGLELKFGTDRAKLEKVGEHKFDGPRRMVEIKFDSTQLPAFQASEDTFTLISEGVALPVGATIEAVEVFMYTDFDSAGDGALLSVGTVNLDRATALDADSLIDAMTQSEAATGGTNVAGWVGTLVGGAKLTVAKLLTWTVTVESYNAGDGVIRIYYSVD